FNGAEFFGVAFENRADLVLEVLALVGQFHAHRTAVMLGAFLDQVTGLDHFLDVIGYVRTEIIAANREFTNRQIVAANVEKNKPLDVVDVLNAELLEL